jgi:dTDP-4-dehydrorhamnose 3,5-epimerase-like enzyme
MALSASSMNSRVITERVVCHVDARGVVFEPLPPELILGQRNVHVVLTEAGGVRGNHAHLAGTETATVFGAALVRIREEGRVRDIRVADGEVVRLTIPPGIAHAFQNTGSKPMLLAVFNTVPHDPARPDLVRDLLL